MPTFDTTTPTIARKFSGIDFTVPAPFTSGHALTSPEAAWMNSVLASVVGNAYSGDLRRALEAANEKAKKDRLASGGKAKDFVPLTYASLPINHAEAFAAKFRDYTLGESNRGSGGKSATDPLSRMVTFLAGEELKGRIVKKGLTVQSFYKAKGADGVQSKWTELLAQLIERDNERLTSQAQAQLDAMSSIDADADDLLDGIELPTEAPEAPAAAE